jgi:hypothetical protein
VTQQGVEALAVVLPPAKLPEARLVRRRGSTAVAARPALAQLLKQQVPEPFKHQEARDARQSPLRVPALLLPESAQEGRFALAAVAAPVLPPQVRTDLGPLELG